MDAHTQPEPTRHWCIRCPCTASVFYLTALLAQFSDQILFRNATLLSGDSINMLAFLRLVHSHKASLMPSRDLSPVPHLQQVPVGSRSIRSAQVCCSSAIT